MQNKQSGAEMIASERQRHISDEGWTSEHGDHHTADELIRAALCYAAPWIGLEQYWPWEAEWYKPDAADRTRNLAKAGALIAAEIDRLKRAAGKS